MQPWVVFKESASWDSSGEWVRRTNKTCKGPVVLERLKNTVLNYMLLGLLAYIVSSFPVPDCPGGMVDYNEDSQEVCQDRQDI